MLFPFPEKSPDTVKEGIDKFFLSYYDGNLNGKLSLVSSSGFDRVTSPCVYPPDPDQMFLKGGSTGILGAGSWIIP